MIEVNFYMKHIPTNEEIRGFVYYDDAKKYGKRVDEPRHTQAFRTLTEVIDNGHYDDINYVIKTPEYIMVINPSSDFIDTLIYTSNTMYDDEDTQCTVRTSVLDEIKSILENDAICKRVSHNKIDCYLAGCGEYWTICLGDVELTDAFCKSMERFFN